MRDLIASNNYTDIHISSKLSYTDLVFLLSLVWSGDLLSTAVLYSHYTPYAKESNPIVSFFLSVDPILFILFKGSTILLSATALLLFRHHIREVRFHLQAVIFFIIVGGAVTLHNLRIFIVIS
jgi:hypothetical protein